MIETVLSLGIKGSDLVISHLKKIQDEKEKFKKPENVTVKPSGQSSGGQTKASPPEPQSAGGQTPQAKQEQTNATKGQTILKAILDALKKQKDEMSKSLESRKQYREKVEDAREEKRERQRFSEDVNAQPVRDYFDKITGAVSSGIQGIASLSAGGALRAATSALKAIPLIGEYSEAAGTAIVDAAQAFRDNVRSAASINYDTAQAKSRIGSLVEGSEGKNFTGRVDIDLNSQRQLAEAIASKYGIVQKPLQDAIKELYRDQNGKAVDVEQAGQLAQGNFAALGTDKGFFLQKIADQLGSLPPSFRQSIQASLLSTVPKSEQRTETSRGARSAVTAFNNQDRSKAGEIANPESVKQALQINDLLNTIDKSLNNGFSQMITSLTLLRKSLEQPQSSQSMSPISNAIQYFTRPTIGKP